MPKNDRVHSPAAAAIGRCLITHWERLTGDRAEPDGLPTLAGDLARLGPAWIALAGELAQHDDIFPSAARAQLAALSAEAGAEPDQRGRSARRPEDLAQILCVAQWLEEYSNLEAQFGLCSIIRAFAGGTAGGTRGASVRPARSPMEPALAAFEPAE